MALTDIQKIDLSDKIGEYFSYGKSQTRMPYKQWLEVKIFGLTKSITEIPKVVVGDENKVVALDNILKDWRANSQKHPIDLKDLANNMTSFFAQVVKPVFAEQVTLSDLQEILSAAIDDFKLEQKQFLREQQYGQTFEDPNTLRNPVGNSDVAPPRSTGPKPEAAKPSADRNSVFEQWNLPAAAAAQDARPPRPPKSTAVAAIQEVPNVSLTKDGPLVLDELPDEEEGVETNRPGSRASKNNEDEYIEVTGVEPNSAAVQAPLPQASEPELTQEIVNQKKALSSALLSQLTELQTSFISAVNSAFRRNNAAVDFANEENKKQFIAFAMTCLNNPAALGQNLAFDGSSGGFLEFKLTAQDKPLIHKAMMADVDYKSAKAQFEAQKKIVEDLYTKVTPKSQRPATPPASAQEPVPQLLPRKTDAEIRAMKMGIESFAAGISNQGVESYLSQYSKSETTKEGLFDVLASALDRAAESAEIESAKPEKKGLFRGMFRGARASASAPNLSDQNNDFVKILDYAKTFSENFKQSEIGKQLQKIDKALVVYLDRFDRLDKAQLDHLEEVAGKIENFAKDKIVFSGALNKVQEIANPKKFKGELKSQAARINGLVVALIEEKIGARRDAADEGYDGSRSPAARGGAAAATQSAPNVGAIYPSLAGFNLNQSAPNVSGAVPSGPAKSSPPRPRVPGDPANTQVLGVPPSVTENQTAINLVAASQQAQPLTREQARTMLNNISSSSTSKEKKTQQIKDLIEGSSYMYGSGTMDNVIKFYAAEKFNNSRLQEFTTKGGIEAIFAERYNADQKSLTIVRARDLRSAIHDLTEVFAAIKQGLQDGQKEDVIIPINTGNHWTLLHVGVEAVSGGGFNVTRNYYDSSGGIGKVIADVDNQIKSNFGEGLAVSSLAKTCESFKQNDGTSCGPIVCTMAREIINGNQIKGGEIPFGASAVRAKIIFDMNERGSNKANDLLYQENQSSALSQSRGGAAR